MTGPRAIPFWSPAEIEAAVSDTIVHLENRGVLGYPTETVYGFGGAVDHDAVDVLVKLKGRPAGKPFLILISSSDMVTRLDLRFTGDAARLAARHWPGPPVSAVHMVVQIKHATAPAPYNPRLTPIGTGP